MLNKNTLNYSDDLIKIVDDGNRILSNIVEKMQEDELINKGLFLMANSYFESTLRDLFFHVMNKLPEKLRKEKLL